jgi:hypothetical protein
MTATALFDALPFEKNEHGHHVVTFAGLALTGLAEIQHLEQQGYHIEPAARVIIYPKGQNFYNQQHMLKEGKIYRQALVRTAEIAKAIRESYSEGGELKMRDMIVPVFLKYGERFGYSDSPAGVQFRLHELIKPEHLNAMGANYVAALHDPIPDFTGNHWQLISRLYRLDDPAPTLTLKPGSPGEEYHDPGIISFNIP